MAEVMASLRGDAPLVRLCLRVLDPPLPASTPPQPLAAAPAPGAGPHSVGSLASTSNPLAPSDRAAERAAEKVRGGLPSVQCSNCAAKRVVEGGHH